jgi:hypothetical protein
MRSQLSQIKERYNTSNKHGHIIKHSFISVYFPRKQEQNTRLSTRNQPKEAE